MDHKETWVQRTDASELWCWRRLLSVTWIAKRSNQSILKEISPDCLLEVLMLKLKVQYFGNFMQRTDLLEKTLILGKTKSRRSGWQRMRWLDGITNLMDMSLSKHQELVMDWEVWHAALLGSQRVRQDWETELNWTELQFKLEVIFILISETNYRKLNLFEDRLTPTTLRTFKWI